VAEKQSNIKQLVGTVLVAGAIGLGGGYVAGDQTAQVEPTAVVEQLDPAVEHSIAYGNGVTNLEGVSMIISGFTPHIHLKWNGDAKSYFVYLDGKKIKKPIVGVGNDIRYTIENLKKGQTYKVAVSAVGTDGKETPPSEPIEVTVK
jgi:hypothetical protein